MWYVGGKKEEKSLFLLYNTVSEVEIAHQFGVCFGAVRAVLKGEKPLSNVWEKPLYNSPRVGEDNLLKHYRLLV